jgi:hypothetical protein
VSHVPGAKEAVHVLDMAWILPALGLTSIALWRRQAHGYVLAGAFLSYAVMLASAIMGMAVFMIRGGHPVARPELLVFGGLLAASLGMLAWYLRSLQPTSAADESNARSPATTDHRCHTTRSSTS